MFSDRFDVLISKIIFKNKKLHFDTFLNKKHFELPPLPQSQTSHNKKTKLRLKKYISS